VLIAQAIACRPSLIIADEPTTALDAATQLETILLLRSLQQKLKLALLLISHHPGVLVPSVQRILVMYGAQIVEEGPAHEVLGSPLHPYTKALMQCGMTSRPHDYLTPPLCSIPGDPPRPEALPVGCAFAPRCTERMEVCESRLPGGVQPAMGRRVWCFKHG